MFAQATDAIFHDVLSCEVGNLCLFATIQDAAIFGVA